MTTFALSPRDIVAGRAVGDEARSIEQQIRDAVQQRRRDSLPLQASAAWSKRHWDLNTACLEASSPGWDGYGALPVDLETFEVASRFLDALPPTPEDPEIAIDPDGEVSITWRRSRHQLFSVSIARGGRISFAGIFGERDRSGTEFFSEEIPSAVLDGLARLFPAGA